MFDNRQVPRDARPLPWAPPVAALCLLLGAAAPVSAQVFGQFSPASVLAAGQRTIGTYGIFTDQSWGALGHLKVGLGSSLDLSASGGFSSYEDALGVDGPNTLLFGVDGRYQVRWAQPDNPVDASVGLGLGIETGSDFTRFDLAPEVLASHRIVYDDAGRAVTPYGSVVLDYQSLDTPWQNDSDSDIDLLARFGGSWEPSSEFALSAEFGFGDGVKFAAGARWNF